MCTHFVVSQESQEEIHEEGLAATEGSNDGQDRNGHVMRNLSER